MDTSDVAVQIAGEIGPSASRRESRDQLGLQQSWASGSGAAGVAAPPKQGTTLPRWRVVLLRFEVGEQCGLDLDLFFDAPRVETPST